MSYNYNFPKCLGSGSGYEKICGSTDPDQRGKYQQKTANIIFWLIKLKSQQTLDYQKRSYRWFTKF